MERFMVVFVASILQEEGVDNALLVARKVAEDLERNELVNRHKVLAAQVRACKSRNWKDVKRETGAGRTFIYKVWNQMRFSVRTDD